MTSAIDIDVTHAGKMNGEGNDFKGRVSSSLALSASPMGAFHSPPLQKSMPRANAGLSTKQLKPFATEDIKILLLENVNKTGQDRLSSRGYQVEALKTSLPEDELIERIRCSGLSAS